LYDALSKNAHLQKFTLSTASKVVDSADGLVIKTRRVSATFTLQHSTRHPWNAPWVAALGQIACLNRMMFRNERSARMFIAEQNE